MLGCSVWMQLVSLGGRGGASHVRCCRPVLSSEDTDWLTDVYGGKAKMNVEGKLTYVDGYV